MTPTLEQEQNAIRAGKRPAVCGVCLRPYAKCAARRKPDPTPEWELRWMWGDR